MPVQVLLEMHFKLLLVMPLGMLVLLLNPLVQLVQLIEIIIFSGETGEAASSTGDASSTAYGNNNDPGYAAWPGSASACACSYWPASGSAY
jgi:hypothetical protein